MLPAIAFRPFRALSPRTVFAAVAGGVLLLTGVSYAAAPSAQAEPRHGSKHTSYHNWFSCETKCETVCYAEEAAVAE